MSGPQESMGNKARLRLMSLVGLLAREGIWTEG
jgi:hypothetical protein